MFCLVFLGFALQNLIYITIFSEKFPHQCKEQTNSKVPLTFPHCTGPHLEYGSHVYVKNKLGSQIYSLVYNVNASFIRLENLIYQNNPFIICTIDQSSIQHLTLNRLNITKPIFLNMYHFSSTLVLLKCHDPFLEYATFESCLSCSSLIWAQNFSIIQCIVNFNTIPYSSKLSLRITSL